MKVHTDIERIFMWADNTRPFVVSLSTLNVSSTVHSLHSNILIVLSHPHNSTLCNNFLLEKHGYSTHSSQSCWYRYHLQCAKNTLLLFLNLLYFVFDVNTSLNSLPDTLHVQKLELHEIGTNLISKNFHYVIELRRYI
jgi:hypothetical protein